MFQTILMICVLAVFTPQKETVERYGRTWEFNGAISQSDWGKLPSIPSGTTGAAWTDKADSKSRLLVLSTPSDKPEAKWSKLVLRQVMENGKWVRHGVEKTTFRDGHIIEVETDHGVPHGMERVWAANGQLTREVPYIKGLRDGKGRAWYENGKKRYVAIYKDDKEISSVAWDEKGDAIHDVPKTDKKVVIVQELKRSSIGKKLRSFDFQITNNTDANLSGLVLQIECKSSEEKYLGSTKLRIGDISSGETLIEKVIVECDVSSHELTSITVAGDQKGKVELEFAP